MKTMKRLFQARYWVRIGAAVLTLGIMHFGGIARSILGVEAAENGAFGCPNVRCLGPNSSFCYRQSDYGCCQDGGCEDYWCPVTLEPC